MPIHRTFRPSRILAYPGGPKVLGKSEQRVALALKDAGVSFDYETEKIPYRVEKDAKYTPDFKLGPKKYLEVKGLFESKDRVKHLMIKEQYPDLDIRFVFDNAHKPINKGSKTTYANWCEKFGFLWAHKEIPKEWLRTMKS